MRAMQQRIYDLLISLNYEVEAEGGRLVFSDPYTAFPESKSACCGRLRDIDPDEWDDEALDLLVVEDGVRPDALAALKGTAEDKGLGFRVETETRFVDRLWKAELLLGAIEDDAHNVALQIPADYEAIDLSVDAWYKRHFDRRLADGAGSKPAANFFDDWLPQRDGDIPIIYAEAGTGKTELAMYLARRSAINYRNHVARGDTAPLPPLIFRIPLSDLNEPTLGAIAAYMDDEIALVRITAGALYQLLVTNRVALILDGLDELDVPILRLKQALSEIASLVDEGAKVAITSRSIAALSGETVVIREGLNGKATPISFVGFNRVQSIDFLESYGVAATRAGQIVDLLPEHFAATPLFLLLGWAAGVADAFDEQITASRRTKLMDILVRQFCEREHKRQGIEVDDQLLFLTWIAFVGSAENRKLTRPELLEVLDGLDRRMVTFPHGFLMVRSDGQGQEFVLFRNGLVERYLVARQIHEDLVREIAAGPEAISAYLERSVHLSQRMMADHTLETLAELLSPSDLKAICGASRGQLTRHHSLARNLMFLALRLVERSDNRTSTDRGRYLADLICTTNLRGANLAGLVVDNIDFTGWDLRLTAARGGRFVGCLLREASLDTTSLIGAQFEACDTAPADREDRNRLTNGLDLLLEVMEMFRIGDSGTFRPTISTRDADSHVMAVLLAYGHVIRGTGARGGKWVLAGRGNRAFTALATNPAPNPQLEPLLRELGTLN